MALYVSCRCGRMYRTEEEFAGRTTNCPYCTRTLVIPRNSEEVQDDDFYRIPKNTVLYCRRAIYSFLLGLCSLGCAFFAGIPAIIFGYLGLMEIRHGLSRLKGTGYAVGGILLGIVGSTATTTGYVVPIVRTVASWNRQAACQNNLKEIGLALHNYVGQHGRFPLAAITDGRGKPLLSWRVAILPYIGPEGEALYQRFHLDEPWDSAHNGMLVRQMPSLFRCPEILVPNKTVYQALIGPGTVFPGDKAPRLQDLVRGTSNTTCIIESVVPVIWSAPFDTDVSDPNYSGDVGTQHFGKSRTLMADGAVY